MRSPCLIRSRIRSSVEKSCVGSDTLEHMDRRIILDGSSRGSNVVPAQECRPPYSAWTGADVTDKDAASSIRPIASRALAAM